MTDPQKHISEIEAVLDHVHDAAKRYLETIQNRPVRPAEAGDAPRELLGSLPEEGDGSIDAIATLTEASTRAAIGSAGPRFFHFVVGGVTPAALAADWLTSAIDQNAGMWATSPLAARLELVALDWLRDLFGLPAGWGGVLTTGATMANYTALAAARRWWGSRHGIDVDTDGISGLPRMPVFSSGYVHASSLKALGMLGMGRSAVSTLQRDDVGRLDLDSLESELGALDGAPSVIIANAGEVNAGDFDPLEDIVDVAERADAWVHVDGAFGLFSRCSPRTLHLTRGIERAHSVICDGHKWLNVAHDCGFAFVRDPSLLGGVFGATASYYVGGGSDQPNFALLAPESSRRARAFGVWATLRAYGRSGYREMVERHLDLTHRLARRIDEAPDLERLADVTLNIVPFRFRPPGEAEGSLDDLNRAVGEAVLDDGRVYVGTTTYGGRVAFRPALVNYRIGEADVDELVDVVREVGAGLVRT